MILATVRRPAFRRTLALVLAVAAIVAAADLLHQRRAAEEQRRDQIVAAYEGSLHRTLDRLYLDVEVVATLFGDGAEANSPAVSAYLAEKREELTPLRTLARLPPGPGGGAVDLLTSPASAGFDPHRLAELPPPPFLVAYPHSIDGTDLLVAIREPALGRRPGRRGELVALVNGSQLLQSAFAGLPPLRAIVQLWSNGQLLGTWPGSDDAAADAGEDREATIHLGNSAVILTTTLPPVPLIAPQASSAALAMALGGIILLLLALAPTRPAIVPAEECGDGPPEAEPHRAVIDRLWLLGDLAGALAHDLSQPLNVIRLAAEGAADRLQRGDGDPARLARSLGNIADQSLRLQDMIDRLRTAARRPTQPPEPVAPVEAVRRALAGVMPRLDADGIRLLWHADPATPRVLGHPARLQQAVANLLANACDAIATAALTRAGPDGRTGTLAVSCRGDGNDWVVITIEDDGPGFPPAVMAGFDTPAAAAFADGHGIGLTVAAGVVAEMGGRVTAANSGHGARVVARLPALAAPLRRAAGEPRHVLVVDDTAEAVGEVAAFLASRGWRVSTATSGNQAWRSFVADPAEAVITDLHMGDGDGFDLIARLRHRAPDTAIIAVTTAHAEDIDRAVGAGAVVVLPKPVALAEIASELDDAVANFD